jgi:hypothetical protein
MKIDRFLPFLISFLFIVCYFASILANSVNVPNGDDLYCLLLFTQHFQDAPSWAGRIHLLLQQWVEHRIVFSKLSALLSYILNGGQVNFITIILIGNAFLIGFFALFRKFLKQLKMSGYYLLPILPILFNPIMYEANLWAGAATVYMPVCFMGLLVVHLLTSEARYGIYGALAIALLATFSFGNGMLSFPAGILVILMLRKYRQLWVWIPVMILGIAFYFQDFFILSATNAFGVAGHFQKPVYLIYNFFGFVGGLLDHTQDSNSPIHMANIPGICFGILLTVMVCFGVWRTFREKWSDSLDYRLRVRWLGMAAFVGVTALLIAYSRTNGESINTLSSRYKIFSMMAVLLVYLAALIYLRQKAVVAWVAGILALCMLGLSYYSSYEKFVNFKSYMLAGQYNYNVNGNWAVYHHTDFYEPASKFVCDTIRRSQRPVFKFETVFTELNHSSLQSAPELTEVTFTQNRDCVGRNSICVALSSDAYPRVSNRFEGIYLVVYNDTNIYLFPAQPRRNGRKAMLMTGDFFKSGFTFTDHFGDILVSGNEGYKVAVFCPTEKQKIRRVRGKIVY